MAWENQEAWQFALMVDNDRWAQEQVLNAAELAWNSREFHPNVKDKIWSADDAAKYHLAGVLKEWVSNRLEDHEHLKNTFSYQLMISLARQAFNRINWYKVAEYYLEQIK